MSICELIENFFIDNMLIGMPSTAATIKNFYCELGYEQCARYWVVKAVGFDKLPGKPFPAHRDLAEMIIKG